MTCKWCVFRKPCPGSDKDDPCPKGYYFIKAAEAQKPEAVLSNSSGLLCCPFCAEALELEEDENGEVFALHPKKLDCILSLYSLDSSQFGDWNIRAT